MTETTPAHRTKVTARSADSILIGKDGERNLDQEARDKAAATAPRAAKAESAPRAEFQRRAPSRARAGDSQ